jgi:hypothetical protein
MTKLLPQKQIDGQILTVRGQKVILDATLAQIYGVPTKRLNEQVRRNRKKFPADFTFRLAKTEWEDLRSQFATLNAQENQHFSRVSGKGSNLKSQNATSSWGYGGRRKLPYVFTEHGSLQAANVLNSSRAVAMSICHSRVR